MTNHLIVESPGTTKKLKKSPKFWNNAEGSLVLSGEFAGQELITAYSRGIRDFSGSVIVGEDEDHHLVRNPFSDILAYGQLNSVTLSERDLSGINLSWSRLENLFLGETNFQSSSFRNCQVISTELTLCDFSQAELSNTSFLNCHLMEVNFSGANLEGVCFEKADLTGADFAGAQLENVDFSTAIIDAVRWHNHQPKPS